MSDLEEPPTKLCKIDDPPSSEPPEGTGTEDESIMEEGQEEWLSEEVLTDDDFNPKLDNDKSDSNFASSSQMSQDLPINELIDQLDSSINTDPDDNDDQKADTELELLEKEDSEKVNDEAENKMYKEDLAEGKGTGQTIEETLNDFENDEHQEENVESFATSKTSNNVVEGKIGKSKMEKSDDDGNDTDDLLRMLGEDENKTKKKVMKKSTDHQQNDEQSTDCDDDDDFVYEGKKSQSMKAGKHVLLKKFPATKAEPENMSDGDDETDASSDDGATQKLYSMKNSSTKTKDSSGVYRRQPVRSKLPEIKVYGKPKPTAKSPQNKMLISKSSTKKPSNVIFQKKPLISHSPKSETKSTESSIQKSKSDSQRLQSQKSGSNVLKSSQISKFKELMASKVKDENDEIIDEEEFLEDDEDFELDDEFAEESDIEDQPKTKQKIMKPEVMDEEVPSDEDSQSENGSLYDELPSSESDDTEDWFKLDIRAERAADYLPFLGSKARELLLEEKRRVSLRLTALRQSLTALTDSARAQADQVREATMTLAELDDMLKAT